MAYDPEQQMQGYAKLAGVLYLVIILLGISGEMLFRSSLIVAGDAMATAANVRASPLTFYSAFVADVIMLICDVAIAVVFYQLFKSVNQLLALMAVVFRLTQAAILGFNLLNYYAPMILLNGISYTAVYETEQLSAMALFFFELHAYGYDLGLLFFAVSNLLLGYLLIKSRYFPVVLGYGLQAAALVYLIGGFVRFMLPDYTSTFEMAYIIPFIAELSFCLWLLVKGVKHHSATVKTAAV